MRLNIAHTTTYRFDRPMHYGLQQLRLTPKNTSGQTVEQWSMNVSGGQIETEFSDHQGNRVSMISFDQDVSEVTVACTGAVDVEDRSGVVGKHRGYIPLWLFQRPTELTRATANVRKLTKGLRAEHDEDIALLHALSARIIAAVPYQIGSTDTATSADAAIEKGAGVCQDHAHIFIAAARALGFPARYVSGYLCITGRSHQDATHAWAEVHVDGIGWVGFDVSNGISPDARYVRVATGCDYREAAPTAGLRFGTGQEKLTVDVIVQQQ